MMYRDEKFYWTYERSVHWPDDYIGLDSMTRWIIENQMVSQMWVYTKYRKASEHTHI